MQTEDWLTVLAILLAPLIALQVSGWLERRREKRRRRLEVFKTLMATRASALSPEHVGALNTIDVEFDGSDEKLKAVRRSWKAYHDHLGESDMDRGQWGTRRQDLLVDLLYELAQSLDYDFDKPEIKRRSYFPDGYIEAENDQLVIRRGFAKIISGESPLPITFFSDGDQDEETKAKLERIGEDFLEHGRIRVEIVNGRPPDEDV